MADYPRILSGPPREDLPYRFWCRCGATWNCEKPQLPQPFYGCSMLAPCTPTAFKEHDDAG